MHDPSLIQRVAIVLAGERNVVGGQCRFIIWFRRWPALCRAMLAQSPACPSLRHTQFGDT
jgi:hypothetical protein